jgi:transposase-like protein
MVAKRKGWTQAQARLVVDEFEAGDLSMAEFARQRGVNAERIRRWRIRFSAEAQERGPRIVELIAQGVVARAT